jgi:secreted PhoX family phosphatase
MLSLATGVCLACDRIDGPMSFEPLQASVVIGSPPAAAPLALPPGLRQRVIVDESGLDIYPDMPDWTDMKTVNESGPHAGRYLYRTHEVRPSRFASAQANRDAGGGAVSVVDLQTGNARVLVQRRDWEALDGPVWTPWDSLLFAEEASSGKSATLPEPDVPEATEGLLYEARLVDGDPATDAGVSVRPLLGSMAHEGIEIDRHGHVYVIDELHKGTLYHFVPDTRGDLGSGRLYALKVDESGSGNGTGPARWVALDMQQVPLSARIAAARADATLYNRPEDLEIIVRQLYVAITGEARVLAVSLGATPVVSEFVAAGSKVPHELPGRTGFRKSDKLARDAAGNLWIVEDNEPSDIWVATPDADGDGHADRVALFDSLSTPGAEASSIYFVTEPGTLFVNVHHADDANDMTLAVSRQ